MSSPTSSDVQGVAPTERQTSDGRSADPASARKREALELFRGLPRHYDALSAALSFWQDPRWRRELVRAVAPQAGQRVKQRSRVELIEAQAEALPFTAASFDALTFTYLLRYVDDPQATLRELARVVRPGGRVASLEFGVPPWPPAYLAWRFYTAIGLPALGRLASREWAEVGRFLGPSIRGFYAEHPLEQIVGYWQQAGFHDVRVLRMSLGGGVVMSATRRAAGGN
jgi:demethylmenaquinone methyltransferase/2-methoxy-6-polyprenyl-1,4-benzoquinol methylase